MARLSFKNKSSRQIFSLLFTAAFIVSCAGQQRLKYAKSYDSPEAALNIIKSTTVPHAVTATAKIEITDKETRYLFKSALMMKRSGALRLESMPMIGPPDLFISIDNGEIRIFIPSKKCFYKGRATARNISKFLHVSVNGNELISLMMGFPLYNENQQQNLTGVLEEKLYRIDQHGEGGKILSFWIDPFVNRVVKISLTQDKNTFYEAVFEKYTTLEGHHMPQSLTITGDRTPTLHIGYSNVQKIPDDQAIFILQVPDGIIPTLLD
jgi:hypothetical protein